jgi:DNA-binding MarR family transcriptional regulator
MSTIVGQRLEEIAQDLFEVMTQLALSTHSHQRRGLNLKEFEFLTLSVLHTHQPMTVGNIQRLLGVLPAQMSRIIRSLENRQPALIECQINARDKRKVDVRLTAAGEAALAAYQEARVRRLADLLRRIPDDEHEDMARLVLKLFDVLRDGTADAE